jgi:hypothetical protein
LVCDPHYLTGVSLYFFGTLLCHGFHLASGSVRRSLNSAAGVRSKDLSFTTTHSGLPLPSPLLSRDRLLHDTY